MSASTTFPGKGASSSAVKGVGQVVVNTSDLNRFRTFYEGVLGLPHVISLRLAEPPHLRYGVFAIGPTTALLAFEASGHDPVAHATGDEAGRRGGIDHVGLRVDPDSFGEVRERLVAAGACTGPVRALGPFLSVPFRDPDGLEGTVVCVNRAFDPTQVDDELIECSNPQWTVDLLTT